MSIYNFVSHNGAKLFQVGIKPDGTLHNPNKYPDDLVRSAVLAADAWRLERRSYAARKAAKTRRGRHHLKLAAAARQYTAGNSCGPRQACVVCGRGLGDPASIARGIGSDCWQEMLALLTEQGNASDQPVHDGGNA